MVSVVLQAARSLIEKGTIYEFWEERCSPPERLNCYLLVWWVFEEYSGIWMPKDMLGQLYRGDSIHSVRDLDNDIGLIFTGVSWWGAYYDDDRAKEGIGHNGIITKTGTVIHACRRHKGVVEESLDKFLSKRELRGMFRITP